MTWITKELQEIVHIQSGGSWGDDPDGSSDCIPVIRTSDIDRDGNVLFERLPIRKISGKTRDRYLCNSGDILVVKSSGSHTNVVTGKTAFFDRDDGEAAFTNFLLRLRPDPTIILPEYLLYYLRSPEIAFLIRQMVATTTYPNLRIIEYRRFPVHFPKKLTEQLSIVARIKECMERVEEIEDLRTEALAEADHLASSLYAAIENGEKWLRMAVGDVIIRSCNGRSIRQDNENASGFVLSLRAVHDVTLNLEQKKPIPLPANIEKQYSIMKGDVFVSRSNTRELVGLSAVATEKPKGRVIYPDLLIKLAVKPDIVYPRFLAYALRTPESRRQIKERAVGTSQSMVKISGERLKEVKLPVPPLSVQAELIEKFDGLHDLAGDLTGNLRAFNSGLLKQSILRKAFAGEL